ncbi:MAG: hypothetical protein ACI87W_000114 [Halieaceae bacterium]|jgi:hypothetical protein
MIKQRIWQSILPIVFTTLLSACGGSSDNVSPGTIVVEVPGSGADLTDTDNDGVPDVNDLCPGTPEGEFVNVDGCSESQLNPGSPDPDPGTGDGIASVIPDSLAGAITDSGRTAGDEFGNRPIFVLDVSALVDGVLDPTGLLVGNDIILEISGGALRVASGILEMARGSVLSGGSQFEFLVIQQGAQLSAEGTAEQPIIFTAAADVAGEAEANDRGLWGGLVLNGFAPINDCPQGTEGGSAGCTKEGEANSGTFGGDDATDSSGTLRYVQVRYAGSNVDPENQLNGIAFQGTGSGTTVEYVQVHNNLDDGVEFFGGTTSVKYLVLTGNADDSLDWTDGWTGSIQYLYVEQTDSADNVIEADNREGDEGASPVAMPAIANFSFFGNSAERSIRLRRGTGGMFWNGIVTGSDACLRIDGSSRDKLGADLSFAGTTFNCTTMHDRDDDGSVEAYLDSAVEVSQVGAQVDPVAPGDSRLEDAGFVGAFGAENWADGWTFAGSVSNPGQPDLGCPAGTSSNGEIIAGKRVCNIEGTITSNVSLSNTYLYQLVGKVTIGDGSSSNTLTLQSGTTVFGGTGFDFLVISQNAQIIANGTSSQPVTLTARADVEGTADIESDRGLWGGLVINGNAPINDCPEGATGGAADCTKEGEANSGTFGGDDPTDSSGTLRYLVVKYAGSNVDPENQLNGIAFQGTGSGTTVEFVQVHNNLDDGIEFFGGTTNAKYIVLTGNADDSLDWTDGWQGSLQYVLIDQAQDAGDNGIEADNREGDENAGPRSAPRIANMTISGNPFERAIRLRRGTGLELYNSVVQGSESCLRIQGESLNQLGDTIVFDGVTLDCGTVNQGDDVAAVQAFLDGSNVAEGPSAAAPADLSGDAFFDDTSFIGAIESDASDWTAGWTVGMPDAGVSFGCPTGTTEAANTIAGKSVCVLSGTYTSAISLTRDNHYILDGKVVIGEEGVPAILNIESGVTVFGDNAEDFLVITRGSRIEANGTPEMPINFTALAEQQGTVSDNSRGLWGGLVINGFAPINDCPEGAEGGSAACTKEGEANSGLFGGDNPNDSSGTLRYVLVKYAGSNVDPENQLNGISFQGVGDATTVEYIQVHNNLDDGIEFFGGTVSAKYVVLTGHADDSLDWTDGWVGRLQYVYIEQTDAGDNGIEADNREGDELATPVSNPSIANMTIAARADQRAIRLRRGTGLLLYSSAVSGETCLRIQGESLNLLGTGIRFDGVQLNCATVNEGDDEVLVQNFLDGSNVTEGAALPSPGALPSDGFFEPNSTIGADIDSWKGTWVFGQ